MDGSRSRYVQRWLQYVSHDRVQEYEQRGWCVTDGLVNTHHGEYATLMSWPHRTPPPGADDGTAVGGAG